MKFRCMLLAAATLWGLSSGQVALAQGAPSPLSIVVPFPAGGASDIFARIMSPEMADALQRNVLVENAPGASGSIAANRVLSRAANADALLMASPTDVILAPAFIPSAKYKPEDFRPITLISRTPLALYVRNELPVNSLDEFVAFAKQNQATPLTYGSVGVGSLYHLATDAFAKAAGVTLTHVPYQGGQPMLNDLMGGRIDLALFPAAGQLSEQVKLGKMRAIGIAGDTPSEFFPGVATFSQSQSLPNWQTFDVWAAIMAPAALPQSQIEALHAAGQAAITKPTVQQRIQAAAGSPAGPAMSLDELQALYAAEVASYADAIKGLDAR